MYKLRQIPSEAQIQKFIRRAVFGTNIYCPECKSRDVVRYNERYRCKKCKGRFSLLSHTWLSNMKLPYEQFWLVLWCWTTQIPIKQTCSLTQLSEVTIRKWFERFREQLPVNQDILQHLVQLDEAYFGGRNGKALFMGKQPGTRKLAFQIVTNEQVVRESALWFLETFVEPGSTLHTDGAAIYTSIQHYWPVEHKRDIHKKFEFELTSEIEGIFGVLRTFIRRMYHHVTNDKLEGVVSEFCYRFSHPEMFENPRYILENTLRVVTTR